MIFMRNTCLYIPPAGEISQYLTKFLSQHFTIANAPCSQITHLILPKPNFPTNEILTALPKDIHIIGGNVAYADYPVYDYLKDPRYLAQNAAITAECALQVAANNFSDTFAGTSVLILGWGRIGKCLAQKLKALGAVVTVAVRNQTDAAILTALGFRATSFTSDFQGYRIVFNTVPHPVTGPLPRKMLQIDLASVPGIRGDHVITARGLPGKLAPEASARLISETIHTYIQEVT